MTSGKSKSNSRELPENFEKIRQFLFKNPFLFLWNVGLLLGGFIFVLYFYEIHYLPNIDGSEWLYLLPIIAVTGVAVLVFMGVMFLLPCFFRWYVNVLFGNANKEEAREEKESEIKKEIVIYHLTVTMPVLIWMLLAFFFYSSINSSLSAIVLWLVSVLIPLVLYVFRSGVLSLYGRRNIISLIISWVLSSLIFLYMMLKIIESSAPIFLPGLSKFPEWLGYFVYVILVIMISICVVFLNIFITQVNENLVRINGIFEIFGFLLLFFLVLIFVAVLYRDPTVPKLVMSIYKVGGFSPDRIILDEKGCKIFEKILCESGKNENKCQMGCEIKELHVLKNITILSRLGSEMLLQYDNHRFLVPKSSVISWSDISPSKTGKSKE